eukprot:6197642-Pleurochrysis_carterae.AAC.1
MAAGKDKAGGQATGASTCRCPSIRSAGRLRTCMIDDEHASSEFLRKTNDGRACAVGIGRCIVIIEDMGKMCPLCAWMPSMSRETQLVRC